MPLRTLIHQGTEWTVWNVVPSLETRLRVNPDGSPVSGWLCFQSSTEKRRIAPVPDGWEVAETRWYHWTGVFRLDRVKPQSGPSERP